MEKPVLHQKMINTPAKPYLLYSSHKTASNVFIVTFLESFLRMISNLSGLISVQLAHAANGNLSLKVDQWPKGRLTSMRE